MAIAFKYLHNTFIFHLLADVENLTEANGVTQYIIEVLFMCKAALRYKIKHFMGHLIFYFFIMCMVGPS